MGQVGKRRGSAGDDNGAELGEAGAVATPTRDSSVISAAASASLSTHASLWVGVRGLIITTTAPDITTAQKPTAAVIVLGLNTMTLSPASTPEARSERATPVASCASWP